MNRVKEGVEKIINYTDDNIIKIANYYLCFFFISMLIILSVKGTTYWGELDDYALPLISIIEEHNLSVSQRDIDSFDQFFPEWSGRLSNHVHLSGKYNRSHTAELAHYFPTHSLLCVPITIILQKVGLPPSLGFAYTNLVLFMSSILFILYGLKVKNKKKLLLILLLTINPIVFYLCWNSSEVSIFSFLVLSMVCWYNGWEKRAAFFLSVAGSMNHTAMFVGFFMIGDYIAKIIQSQKGLSLSAMIKNNWKRVICYGLCYIYCLVPFAYFFYHTGFEFLMIYSRVSDISQIWDRALAYIIDFNFGLLPYFFIILIVVVLLFGFAIKRKEIRYIELLFAFIGILLCFSLEYHINCGMSGIARYCAWSSVLLIFAVGLYYDDLIRIKVVKYMVECGFLTHIVVLSLIITTFGPWSAENAVYIDMTPIARKVLQAAPWLYNPLPSTFNSRVEHIDGGYDYTTPIFYYAEDGYIRKVLLSETDLHDLKGSLVSLANNNEIVDNILSSFQSDIGYISIDKKFQIVNAPNYKLGETINFMYDGYNANSFFCKGIAAKERWGSWSYGKEIIMYFRLEKRQEIIKGKINAISANENQHIKIIANDSLVYDDYFSGGDLYFKFNSSHSLEKIKIIIVDDNGVDNGALGFINMQLY